MAEFAEDEEPDEISEEEVIAISKHFLMSSPPCQFKEVLADVRKLVDGKILTDDFVKSVARAHNVKNGLVVNNHASASKMVVCKQGEVDESHYYDPRSGSVLGVDHLSGATEASELEAPAATTVEMQRAELQKAAQEYVKSYYNTPDSAAGVFAPGGTQLVVRIVGQKANLRSMWSGRWASEWFIDLSDSSCTISGTVAVTAHYFEDGNVQMNTNRKVAASTFQFGGLTSFVKTIVEHIQTVEGEVHTGLSEMYLNMNDVTFKAMRRTLPVTRTKMDWNVNAHKMAKAVRK